MTRAGPARSALFRGLALLCGCCAGGAGSARAEPATALLVGGEPARGVKIALPRTREPLERDLVARALAQAPGLDPARIAVVARVDALLTEARAHAAALDEPEALAALAEAARACEQLGDVPGAAAWDAEVQRQLGLAAAHAGLEELMSSTFRRAVTLEPGRALLPAEAPPQVVERYEAARAALASAPEGELRVEASVPGARVFLDDVELGAAPLTLRAPVGRHVLRLEAGGHRPYGAFVDLLAGERPAFRVALSPLPALEHARALGVAARRRAYAHMPALIAELRSLDVAAVLVVEQAASGRQLLVRCDAQRCAGPSRVEHGARVRDGGTPLSASALADARRWLEAGSPGASNDRADTWWSRWYVWVAAAAAVTAGVASAIALQPDARHELRVVVEPGALR